MSKPQAAFAPFHRARFRNMWAATLVSNLGSLIQGVGAAWLMTSIADSVSMVAMVQAAATLPIMLFALIGGAVADSFHRRNVMLAAQLFMFVVSVALTLATWFGLITPWLLLAFTFLIGCGVAINNPTWHATVGDLVPRDELRAAVALNSVGPAIGGAIVAATGAVAAVAANMASDLPLLFVMWRWKPEAAATTLPREPIGSAIVTGLRYVAMSPETHKVLARAFCFAFGAVVIPALLPVVAANLLGGGAFVYGLMLGAFGLGAVAGAFIGHNWQQRIGTEWMIRIAFTGFAICVFVTGTSTSAWLTGLVQVLGGACWVFGFALMNATVQLSTPRWVVGRVLSTFQTIVFGGMAIGAWFWGAVVDWADLQVAHSSAGLLLLGGAALGLLIPLPRQVTLNVDPADQWREPHLELELQPRSGPIHVEVAYVVAPENVERFLHAMVDRKRIRRRDGAQHWMLLRDLAKPDTWYERYTTPTWADYVRHNMRRTKGDATVNDRLLALHEGPDPPAVRRFIERQPDWMSAMKGSGRAGEVP